MGRIFATLVDKIWLLDMSIPKASPAHKEPTPKAPAVKDCAGLMGIAKAIIKLVATKLHQGKLP